MSNIHCAISSCKISQYNKPPGVTFYSCPTSIEMRNRWLLLLKNKCSMLDWSKSKICSRHFENKYLDSQRKLKEFAIPTLFPLQKVNRTSRIPDESVEKAIGELSQAELIIDVKSTLKRVQEPENAQNYINASLKCKADTPQEVQLWLLAKKQDELITRLMEQVSQSKKHAGLLQKNLEESRTSKKQMEQNIETLKYIVKCLQEKHATLEEQIEILTAVESR